MYCVAYDVNHNSFTAPHGNCNCIYYEKRKDGLVHYYGPWKFLAKDRSRGRICRIAQSAPASCTQYICAKSYISISFKGNIPESYILGYVRLIKGVSDHEILACINRNDCGITCFIYRRYCVI